MVDPLMVSFEAGDRGLWAIVGNTTILGEPLAEAPALAVSEGRPGEPPGDSNAAWVLRGVVSNGRYVTRAEQDALQAAQVGLGRPAATQAVLIPIRKTAAWWSLTQDERREVFEERSHHIAAALRALPGVSRRLHHSRDLGEPFDFLTWFEFAPSHEAVFDDVLADMRATEEWRYVDREVEIRLTRRAPA